MIISSNQNPKVKELKKLMTDKSLMFFDNPKLVNEAYLAGHKILYLIKREDFNEQTDYGGEEIVLSSAVFKTFCSTENSQGLIGVVEYNFSPIKKPGGNFLVLDGLQDPGNVGTLIRSALGANFRDIYLIDSVKPTNDKVVRGSMGAIFKTNIYSCTREKFLQEFKTWNLPLFSCNLNGDNVFNASFPPKVGIIVGNEGNGVSNELQNASTQTVQIPMQNNLESLNAGVSGSIVMYQIASKMQKTNN